MLICGINEILGGRWLQKLNFGLIFSLVDFQA